MDKDTRLEFCEWVEGRTKAAERAKELSFQHRGVWFFASAAMCADKSLIETKEGLMDRLEPHFLYLPMNEPNPFVAYQNGQKKKKWGIEK